MKTAARRTALWLFVLALAVGAGRFGLLAYSEFVYDEEEYKTGSIAALVMDDPQLPIFEYQPGDYEGGTLLFGLLTIPFFAVLGKTYLALKLLALTTSVLMAVFAAWFAARAGGRAAGVATGVLFVLPAPYVLQVGLIPWGNYAENITLTFAALLVASYAFTARRGRTAAYFGLGALCGLGVYVHYGFLVTVVTLGALWWVGRPEGPKARPLIASLAGALVGFSPWIAYNVSHHFWGVGRFTDAVAQTPGLAHRITTGFQRLAMLWADDVPAGLHFHAATLGAVKTLAYTYLLLVLALIAALIVRRRGAIRAMTVAVWPMEQGAATTPGFWSLAPVVYLVLYSLVFSFTDYGIFRREWGVVDPESHCHIFALYPMLLLAAGLAVGAVAGRGRRVAVVAVALVAALGALGYARLLTPERPQWDRMRVPAYDLGVIYMEMGIKYGIDADQAARLEARLSGMPLRNFVHGLGLKYGLDHTTSLQVALDKCATQPDELLPYCWYGVGTGIYTNEAVPLEDRDRTVQAAPEPAKMWITFGGCLGDIWRERFDHFTCQAAKSADIAALAPPGEAEYLTTFVAGHVATAAAMPAKN